MVHMKINDLLTQLELKARNIKETIETNFKMSVDNVVELLLEIRNNLHLSEKKFISNLNFCLKSIMTHKLYDLTMIEMLEEIDGKSSNLD
jgi:hypothetical protein